MSKAHDAYSSSRCNNAAAISRTRAIVIPFSYYHGPGDNPGWLQFDERPLLSNGRR